MRLPLPGAPEDVTLKGVPFLDCVCCLRSTGKVYEALCPACWAHVPRPLRRKLRRAERKNWRSVDRWQAATLIWSFLQANPPPGWP